MQAREVWVLLILLMIRPAAVYAQSSCAAPALSDQQVKEIIDRERAAATGLPDPFPEFRWEVRRQGCYYVYAEYGLPETPGYDRVIKLNQYGAIVDVHGHKHTHEGPLKCPDKVFTEAELAQIVKQEREKRQDLPPPFADHRTRVDRLRCLYLYFEYNVPARRGDYQVFTIDPLGELMDFSRSQPY